MAAECQKLVDAYVKWLRQGFKTIEVNGYCEITTPFLDRHNDMLQIYVRKEDKKLILTDDSYTISDLKLGGCSLDTPHRRALLESILAGFGVRIENDALVTTAGIKEFPQKKHALIQAMLSVNDLFATAAERVSNIFLEDVAQFLDFEDVRYTPEMQITGKSGFANRFHFVIPKSSKAPERFLQAVNEPNQQSARLVMFSWDDIRQVRREAVQMYAFLNDSEKEVSSDVVEALENYEIVPVRWSKRDDFREDLAA